MNTVKWWQWLCVGLLAAACSMGMVGCSDDDDDENEDVPGATSVVVKTQTVNGVTRTNLVIVTNPPAATPAPTNTPAPAPAAASQVLLDASYGIAGNDGLGVLTSPAPAAGRVTITASWTAIDLIAGGAPIDIPLEFKVNEGVAGATGSFHNPGHPSPFSSAVSTPASLSCKIQVMNNVADSMATIHLKATWTPD